MNIKATIQYDVRKYKHLFTMYLYDINLFLASQKAHPDKNAKTATQILQ